MERDEFWLEMILRMATMLRAGTEKERPIDCRRATTPGNADPDETGRPTLAVVRGGRRVGAKSGPQRPALRVIEGGKVERRASES